MIIRFGTLLAATAALVLVLPLAVSAADGEATLTIGTEQVEEGASVYSNACAECHGGRLEGFAHFPPLVGEAFHDEWSDRPIADLHTYVVEQMPLGAGGSLSDEAYAAVVAYLLERNGFEAGGDPFDPSDESVLELELTFPD